MPASAPMSAMPIVWKPRRAVSSAAADSIRSRRSGSGRRRPDEGATVIWPSWQPGATVARRVNCESLGRARVDVIENTEARDLRAAVGAIAAPYGGRYYVEHARAGRECTELWHALGDAGFMGANIP